MLYDLITQQSIKHKEPLDQLACTVHTLTLAFGLLRNVLQIILITYLGCIIFATLNPQLCQLFNEFVVLLNMNENNIVDLCNNENNEYHHTVKLIPASQIPLRSILEYCDSNKIIIVLFCSIVQETTKVEFLIHPNTHYLYHPQESPKSCHGIYDPTSFMGHGFSAAGTLRRQLLGVTLY